MSQPNSPRTAFDFPYEDNLTEEAVRAYLLTLLLPPSFPTGYVIYSDKLSETGKGAYYFVQRGTWGMVSAELGSTYDQAQLLIDHFNWLFYNKSN